MNIFLHRAVFVLFLVAGLFCRTNSGNAYAEDLNCASVKKIIGNSILEKRWDAIVGLTRGQRSCLYVGLSRAQASWLKLAAPLLDDLAVDAPKDRVYDLMASLGSALEISPVLVFENLPSKSALGVLEQACVSVPFDKIDGGTNMADAPLAKRKARLLELYDPRWLKYRTVCLDAIEKFSSKEQQRLGCMG